MVEFVPAYFAVYLWLLSIKIESIYIYRKCQCPVLLSFSLLSIVLRHFERMTGDNDDQSNYQ